MDNIMSQENMFSYKYSAKENAEAEEIRRRYMPRCETPMDEVKRLDAQVQNAGVVESLCIGITGSLMLGLGMSFAMQVMGGGVATMLFGIVVGIVGMTGMAAAYPVYRAQKRKVKEKLTPKILELIDTLTINN